LEFLDEKLVDHQPIILSHASVPLSYLELPDENLVYDAPFLAGPADKKHINYLMPVPLSYLEPRTSSTMSLFLPAHRTNSQYTIPSLCPFKLPGAPGREPRLRCPSPDFQSILSYLKFLDEKLVYDVPFLAGPADKQPIHYLMPLSL
jgi:hypothetical protein